MDVKAGKYHSYGNDFLVVDGEVSPRDWPDLTRALCDPHFGVGADGCVFLRPSGEGGDFDFRIFNRDGSEATMSGNGARCAAAFLLHRRRTGGPTVRLHAVSGVKIYQLLEESDRRWRFRSRMGRPRFEPDAVPFQAPDAGAGEGSWTISAAGREVSVRPLSVGNPQCVVLVAEPPTEAEFQELGAALESHPLFPDRTNVSFVRPAARDLLEIRIWERGVGPTHSSGTGSCGAAVAAIRAGLVQSPVRVRTATGTQEVEWAPGDEIALTGWAEFVADMVFYWRRPARS